MSRAIDMIREGSALLNTEIVTLVRSGQTMNTEDCVFGYVIEPDNDSMLEVEVQSLAIVNDELYAFMTETEDIDYSEEEALRLLKERMIVSFLAGSSSTRGSTGYSFLL